MAPQVSADRKGFWSDALIDWPTSLSKSLEPLFVGGVSVDRVMVSEGTSVLPSSPTVFPVHVASDLPDALGLVLSHSDARKLLHWATGEDVGDDDAPFTNAGDSLLEDFALRVMNSLAAVLSSLAEVDLKLGARADFLPETPDPECVASLALVRDGDRLSLHVVLSESLAARLSTGRRQAASPFPQIRRQPVVPSQNLDVLMDVPLRLVVILGRSEVALRDLLATGPGSVVELDRWAGEPLEIEVNGKLVGRGEVVVREDRFAIKVLDMVDSREGTRALASKPSRKSGHGDRT